MPSLPGLPLLLGQGVGALPLPVALSLDSPCPCLALWASGIIV